MEKDFATVTPEEKREIERWMLKTNGSKHNVHIDALSLILYKLHMLEEKIDKIKYQAETHWVD